MPRNPARKVPRKLPKIGPRFDSGTMCWDRTDGNPTVTGDKEADERIIRGIMDETHGEWTNPPTDFFGRDNLGIKRKDMPQFEGNIFDRTSSGRKFLDSLIEKGIVIEDNFIEVCTLRSTQDQLEGKKIKTKLSTIKKVGGNLERKKTSKKLSKKYLGYVKELARPIIVSQDGYVLDGHHKWAALLAWDFIDRADKPVKLHVKVVHMPIKELYKAAMKTKFATRSTTY